MSRTTTTPAHLLALAICATAAACGGGGSDPAPPADPGSGASWTAGQFLPEESFAARCAVPRTDTDPVTGQPLFDDIPGSTLEENNWLRSWTNELYLWYDEVPDQDPAAFDDPLEYFATLRTSATTPSGNPKDRFHFARNSAQWQAESQSGVSAGYGMQIAVIEPLPPREIVVAYTHPGSPAALAGVARGDRILEVDGEDAVNGNTQAIVDVLNTGLFPAAAGERHEFVMTAAGSVGLAQTRTLDSEEIVTVPVQNVGTVTSPQGAVVGYMHFLDHIAPAEAGLRDAVAFLDTQDIEDLVIDLRYNGGGFLALASQLAYMVAGPVPTVGRTFEAVEFNDQHPTTNPVTGTPIQPLPFLDITIGLGNAPPNQALPSLDLNRVFVITGPGTCSASESVINSLRGVGIEVIQIGGRTCGKPYGFYPEDNCGTTYFSIQFRGINDAGFGDFADGFAPAGSGAITDADLPGCAVADDFDHALGDIAEARLAAALQYRDTSTCPLVAATLTAVQSSVRSQTESTDEGPALAIAPGPPARTNKFLSPGFRPSP